MGLPAPLRRVLVLALLAGALTTSACAAESSHAAVTLGSTLETEPTGTTTCSSTDLLRGCLGVNDALPGRELTAPLSGVIVRWRARFAAETDAQALRIRVVRRIDEAHFALISSEELESIPPGDGTYTFPAQLPIAKGDQVGLESGNGTKISWQAPLAGAQMIIYGSETPFDDGGITPAPAFPPFADFELAYNVDVEPDCDGDRLGDETQDTVTSSCNPLSPSNLITLGKPKLNKKKGTAKLPVTVPGPGTLTLTGKGVVKQTKTPIAAATVKLMVESKGKKMRKLDNAGKVKVKITVAYTPTGGTPNSQSKTLVLKKVLQ
jgi:hypothetical protein